MAISIQDGPNCCAIREIESLNGYHDPRTALQTLCRTNWNRYTNCLNDLGSFVLFSTVVKINARKYDAEPGTMASLRYDAEIGEKFAAYIKQHHLGRVVSCGARMNRLNHPNHKVMVWMWLPSRVGLKRWWSLNEGKKGDDV